MDRPIGPRFFEEDGKVMFEFVVDARNVVGPREATDEDKTQHADLWAEFDASKPKAKGK